MKKLAIGCAVVLVVFGIAAAGVGYYLYRQVRSTVAQFAEFNQIPEIERGVRARGGFEPPPSGELTESQISRLVRVQTVVRDRLGERAAELEAKYKSITEKPQTSLRDLPALAAAYRDLAALWLEAKRRQVDALNEVDFSLEEYRWVREQAYRALGVPFMDLDVGKLVEEVRSGRGSSQAGELRGALSAAGPESNRRLVEAFKKQLEHNLALASFGL